MLFVICCSLSLIKTFLSHTSLSHTLTHTYLFVVFIFVTPYIGDGTCSIIAVVYDFFLVVSCLLGSVVFIHLLLLCDGVAQQCSQCTNRCPPLIGICMNFTAGSVGKLPHRFRRYFVFSTLLISMSTFSVLYSIVGQNLVLSPRWMLVWSIAILFINISNFSLLSLLIFEVGGELYARQREERQKTAYRDKFMEQKDGVKRLQEGWLITDESITFAGDHPIGTGASASVYAALWEPLADADAKVAVKVLNRAGDLTELNKEIELMQRLACSRLVHFFGAGKLAIDSSYGTSGTLFLVTELMHGGDLGSYLMDADAIQRWPWKSRLQVAVDIAQGMAYLHDHDVAHRDLKPGNVLLDMKKRRAKVADFGLAKLLKRKTSLAHHANEEMDEEMAGGRGVGFVTGMLGSGPFMAPELWSGRKVEGIDPFAVDVFAMAVTLWMIMEAPQLPYVQQGWNPQFTYQLATMVGEQELRPLFATSERAKKQRPEGYTSLMEQGWDQYAQRRPNMLTVAGELKRMMDEAK